MPIDIQLKGLSKGVKLLNGIIRLEEYTIYTEV